MEVQIGSLVSSIFNSVGLLVLLAFLGLYVCVVALGLYVSGVAFWTEMKKRAARRKPIEDVMKVILEADEALPYLDDNLLHAAREVVGTSEAAQAILDAGDTHPPALRKAAETVLGAQQAAQNIIEASAHKETIAAAAALIHRLAEEH